MATSARPTTHLTQSLDIVGASASLACAVHCAVVALFLGFLPAASVLSAPWIEWAFLAASTLVGVAALVPGFRRHRRSLPLALFVLGISALMLLRAFKVPSGLFELTVVAAAASCLVSAHWINRGALHRCSCGPAHHR